jgi:hypothetical protein
VRGHASLRRQVPLLQGILGTLSSASNPFNIGTKVDAHHGDGAFGGRDVGPDDVSMSLSIDTLDSAV